MRKRRSDTNQFDEGKRIMMKGVNGDKKAVKEAHDIFLGLRKAEANNALIEAYYGSTLTLLARDAVEPIEKADNAQEGLDSLNRAVSINPKNKEIRLLRAKVCLRLPESYFHCSQTAIEDLTYLLNRYKKDSTYLTTDQVQEITKDLHTAQQNAKNN
ncbi:hypothetical protein [Gracilibacillus massiliensis]|uniref:hypothetical protein n=1 Tax=Gracilibacillus massiliensis TaxID=1564956 RepID=UPI000B2B7677|nr:hypothetical protein [Gracilibacillus massiliensis]